MLHHRISDISLHSVSELFEVHSRWDRSAIWFQAEVSKRAIPRKLWQKMPLHHNGIFKEVANRESWDEEGVYSSTVSAFRNAPLAFYLLVLLVVPITD